MLDHAQHRVDGREPPRARSASTTSTARGSCRTCRWRTSPSAMTTHYAGSRSRLRGHLAAPSPGQLAAVPREVAPATSSSACPACGRRSTPACMPRSRPTRTKQAQFDAGARGRRSPIAERTRAGAPRRRGATPRTSSSTPWRSRRSRELLGLDAAASRASPARRRSRPSSSSWFRAIGVPLSEVYGMSRDHRPDDLGRRTAIKPGTVGPGDPRLRGAPRRRRRGHLPGRQRVPRATSTIPRRRPRRSTPTAGSTPATSASSTTTATSRIVDRKKELIITAGGKNISPANLEAALKTHPLIGQACAIGDQRAVRVRAGGARSRHRAGLGREPRHRGHDAWPSWPTDPDVLAEIERRSRAADGAFNNAERVKKVTVLRDEWLPDSEELTPTMQAQAARHRAASTRARSTRSTTARRGVRPAIATSVAFVTLAARDSSARPARETSSAASSACVG